MINVYWTFPNSSIITNCFLEIAINFWSTKSYDEILAFNKNTEVKKLVISGQKTLWGF